MAQKIKDMSTIDLFVSLQLLGVVSHNMDSLFSYAKENMEKGRIGPSYIGELEKKLVRNLESNGLILEEIEKELYSRIRKRFPSAILPSHIDALSHALEKEMANLEKKDNGDVDRGKILSMKPKE